MLIWGGRVGLEMDYDVLLVSTHQGLREGLRAVLQIIGGFDSAKICEAASATDAIRTIDDAVAGGGRIGVVLADFELPREADCLYVLKYVKTNYNSIPVIITSLEASNYRAPHWYDNFAGILVDNGAFAHVQKDAPAAVLVGLVHSALSKHKTE